MASKRSFFSLDQFRRKPVIQRILLKYEINYQLMKLFSKKHFVKGLIYRIIKADSFFDLEEEITW